MAAAANVIPLRWTAKGFVRAGVVFFTEGAIMRVRGPNGRDDLRVALLEEIDRRAAVFVKLQPLDPSLPFPRVSMPGITSVGRSSSCDSCGDGMDNGRGGMCALCTLALQRTLRGLGRLK